MKVVLQRVSRASRVGRGLRVAARSDSGLLVLLGIAAGDGEDDAARLAGKVARLRVFEDDAGRFDRSLLDTGGAALVVSQFTLLADTAKGNRPSFTAAAEPERAEPLYERFCAALRELGVPVETGVFGARMEVELVNDGPVTIVLAVSSAALALALGAAVLHALWNLLLAGSRDVLAATAVALCASLVVAAPFAVLTWGIEREAIPWLVASAALEFAYFFTLTAAYQRSELSLVYPLARGGAPVLVLLGALATGVVPDRLGDGGCARRRSRRRARPRDPGRRPAGRAARARDRGADRRLHARRRGGDPAMPSRCRTSCSR